MSEMQMPAYLQRRQVAPAINEEMLGGITAALPPHLSIAENRFTLVDAAGNTKPIPTFHLDVCIIGSNPTTSRLFYDPATPFDPKGDNGAPPICWSDNGVGPSRQSSMPQSPTCAVCPNAEWGSAVSKITGRGVPACQTGKKLAFIVPGDDSNLVYMLKVPPASLKNLAGYVKTLAGHSLGGRPVTPPDAITRLEFDGQGIIKFTPVGIVDEDTFNRTELAYGTDIIAQVTGRDDTPIDAARQLAQPAARPAQQLAPPAAPMAPPKPVAPQAPAFGQQTSPVAPFQQPQAPAFGQQTAAAQADPPKAPRKPRTPKVEPAAAIPQDGMEIPSFLRRTPEAPAAAKPAAPAFGMVNEAPAPDAGVNEALAKAFALPGV